MSAGSDALYCVEVTTPHGGQCVSSQDIIRAYDTLDANGQQAFSGAI